MERVSKNVQSVCKRSDNKVWSRSKAIMMHSINFSALLRWSIGELTGQHLT